MALTWSLVATISREADLSTTQRIGGAVSGNRVIIYMRRNASLELWRSDDRGVTWAFHTVTGASTGSITGPSLVFDTKYWIHDLSNNILIHTPSTNPGAGGFTSELTNTLAGPEYPDPTDQSPFLYLATVSGGGTPPNAVFRRTGVATFTTLEVPAGDTSDVLIQIPGTSDLLISEGASGILRRITTAASPVTIVNTFTMASAPHIQVPLRAAVALSSTQYWVSAAAADNNPAKIYRTTNGGTSWTETNPATGFWGAFAGGGRQGHGSAFVSFGGSTYGFLTFKDTGLVLEDREHVKVMKFNTATGVWDPESNDTDDNFKIIHTLRGINASGDMDFYAVTYDAATDTAKVYRTTVTQLAAGIVTSKALCWDFRELPVHGSRWTYHTPFKVGHAIATGGRGDAERVHFVRNDTPRLVEFPSGTTDEGTAISWKWKSRAYAFGAMLWEKGIRQIAAVCLGTTGTIVVDLFEDLAAVAARTYSLVFTGTPHERKSTKRIHADVQARTIQVQLTGTADTFEASGLEVEPTRKRRPTNP